jgi:hypothetical protein
MTDTQSALWELLAECEARGIHLVATGSDGLTIDSPRDSLTPQLLTQLKSHKLALLDFLESLEERSAIIEFDAGLSRQEAEKLAATNTGHKVQYSI